uniref:Putative HIRAN domain containing protein n=1 Tax=viral metagenome TaxID=1070528 RepID=A0A6M3JZE1_9ZZZZ
MEEILSFLIAGVQHHEGKERIDEIKEGDKVHLILEPDNKYDSNAIRIEWANCMLGYVPKIKNRVLLQYINMYEISAEIKKADPKANLWTALEVAVYKDA